MQIDVHTHLFSSACKDKQVGHRLTDPLRSHNVARVVNSTEDNIKVKEKGS
jgi:hypothetical protein